MPTYPAWRLQALCPSLSHQSPPHPIVNWGLSGNTRWRSSAQSGDSGWAEQSCRLRPTATYMGDPALFKPGDQPHHWVFCPSAPQFPQESPQLMKWCSRLEEALPRHPSPAAGGSRAVQVTDAAPMARQAEPGGCQGFGLRQGDDKALPEPGVDAST